MKNIFTSHTIEELTKTGIYKITCLGNNKIYIGSACGTNKYPKKCGFYRRWLDHVRKLNLNSHRNPYLQNSWNKYGKESFVFQILEICDKEIAKDREDFYINEYKSYIDKLGFNILKNHLANYSKFSEEHRQKISNSLKGRKRPDSISINTRIAVYQLDQNKNIIQQYRSITEAAKATGIMRQDIGQACIGIKIKKAGGFFWKKVKDIV